MDAKSYSEDTILKSDFDAKYSQAELDMAYKAGMKEIAEKVEPFIGRYENCDYVCGEPDIFCDLNNKCQYARWLAFLKGKGL